MNPHETIAFYRKRLPHWIVDDATYFVTICLKGAIPEKAAWQIRSESERLHNLEGQGLLLQKKRILIEVEEWLDQASPSCNLAQPAVFSELQQAIDYREEQETWRMVEYVVMPSHIHLFFQVMKGELHDILTDFKHWTAVKINRILGRSGQLWMREWFDHWARSAEQAEKIIRYIIDNPVKAGLVKSAEQWPYSSRTAAPQTPTAGSSRRDDPTAMILLCPTK